MRNEPNTGGNGIVPKNALPEEVRLTSAAVWAAGILHDRFQLLSTALAPAIAGSFDDPEIVHQLRVSCRRAVAALELLAGFLPADEQRAMIRRLKRLRRSAGEARDIDVLRQRWKSAKKPLSGKRHRRIVRFLKRRCKKVLRNLRNSLSGIANGDFQQQCTDLVNQVEKPNARGMTRHAAQRDLLLAAVQSYFAGSEGPFVTIDDWHRLRIQGKRLRYALELLKDTEWKPAVSPILTMLRDFQDRLGQMNDHAAAENRIRQWRRKVSGDKLRKALKRLRRAELDCLRNSLATVQSWWTDTRQAELNTSLLELAQHMQREQRANETNETTPPSAEGSPVKSSDPSVELR